MHEDEHGDDKIVVNPECPLAGHSGSILRAQFSDDGAQVISGGRDLTVRFFEVASGRQVRQIAGKQCPLTGPSCATYSDLHTGNRHVVTVDGHTLVIYEVGKEQQYPGDGVACFKAPQAITSVEWYGAAICVGCMGGAVCILSAPFLTS